MADTKASASLSDIERAAVKQRAKELRDQEKAGKSRAAGEKQVKDAIAALSGTDQEIAQGFYAAVSEVAPQLVPKTYYGFPGFANAEGKMVVFVQPTAKFGTRYATLAFEDRAKLDDGDLWPSAFAVLAWTPEVDGRVRELVKRAVG